MSRTQQFRANVTNTRQYEGRILCIAL